MAKHIPFDPPKPTTAPGKGMVLQLVPGMRFCETCRQYRPKPKGPTVKGWKCIPCKTGNPQND